MIKNNRPRFMKMRRNLSKSFSQDVADTINAYWRVDVAHVSNHNEVIISDGQLVNGVPAIANDPSAAYKHDDIVWMYWDGKNLRMRR